MKYALLLSAMLALPAQAQMFSGNKLLDIFKKAEVSDNHIDWGFTRGYVAGVYDANINVTFCTPGTMSLGQISDMTHKYLENNPAVRHMPAEAIIIYFLGKTWPCAKKGASL
jgi:hypothetical protein